METTPPTSRAEVKDPVGIRGWPKEKGRDGERTPMQWNTSANAGFCPAGVKPWLPIPSDYVTVNVQVEQPEPASLLNWYESLIRLKKTNPAFAQGAETMLDTDNNKVLSWMRQAPGSPAAVVSLNFTAEPQTVSLTTPGTIAGSGKLTTLLKTPGAQDPVSLRSIELGPYGVYVGEVQP